MSIPGLVWAASANSRNLFLSIAEPASGIMRASGHSFRSGLEGMIYLAYGTREPNDICYYPRSNKIFFRGLGVIARLELLEYSDGEPS